jgi:crotonobetainyl-CoA:carnitine CoA-transferase CaiB-like acyl-CoA transferase
VTAGPVLNAKDAVEDPGVAASRATQRLPATADYFETEFPAPPYHFSKSDVRIRTAPALFGEHNAYVYRELLGYSEEELAALEAQGHVTESYTADVIANA